jgi:anthranilate synthase component 1
MNELSFNQFVAEGYNHIPVFKEIVLDTDTALGLYLKLANSAYSYLFESVQGGDKWSRYSIIGLPAQTIIKVFGKKISIQDNGKIKETLNVDDPLSWIEAYQNNFKVPMIDELPEFNGGLVGYFGYEIIQYIEPKLASIKQLDELGIADILLMVSNDLVVFDNLANKAFVMTHIDPNQQTLKSAYKKLDKIEENIEKPIPKSQQSFESVGKFQSSFGEVAFKEAVEKIQAYIAKGDAMQVVPSQRLKAEFKAPPIELYRQLRRLNPSPYMYYLHLDEVCIVGSSPEILTRIDANHKATVRPMAGTRARGKNLQQDLALEKELLADTKEIAEHLMLIDLGRNDLGRIAKVGSVNLTDKMFVERYSHVMHIVSNVECDIKAGVSAMDVLRATFPAGTLSGAPKVRAMEIIAEVETLKRNVYSGAIGYLSWHGYMDLAIAIRTAIIKDEMLYVQAGAGVVFDSDPQSEWNETLYKAQALIKAAQKV